MNEFESYTPIDASNLLLRQMQQKNISTNVPDTSNGFDPYQAILKRKQQIDNTQVPPIQDINPNDLYELQEFCKQHNIIGFSFGRLNPKAALMMLKQKMGIKVETPTIASNAQKQVLCG